MPTMDIDVDVPTYLQTATQEAPESLQGYFLQFEDLWERKLWKQLTDLLTEFYQEPDSKSYRLKVFKSFISNFAKHINQLKLVTFGIAAAKECTDSKSALKFMDGLSKKVDAPTSRDAFVYATIDLARLQLLLDDQDAARSATLEAGKILDDLDSVDPLINAAYYRVSASYHKAKSDYAAYYRNALLYLACVKTEDIPASEAFQMAYDLSVAALLGKNIYNFGELLLHPILNALDGTEHMWLKSFLSSLNSGDMTTFESLLGNAANRPLLQQSVPFLRQKICLMALIEAIFQRPPHDRILPFSVVGAETRLPVHEVEHLVMKALSLKLIKGSIDQVDSAVHITWVQPRVLNLQQIDSMKSRLTDWSADVKQLESHMHQHSASFIEVS